MELIGASAAKKRDRNRLKYKYRGIKDHLVILNSLRIHLGGETYHRVFLGGKFVPNLSIIKVVEFLTVKEDSRGKPKKARKM